MDEVFNATLGLPAGTKLDLFSVDGSEALSSPYAYSVVGTAPTDAVIDFSTLLGKPAEIKVSDLGGADRYYHGLIIGARFEGQIGALHGYRLEIAPWLWLLTRSSNLRVFQKKSTPEIIKSIFANYAGSVADDLKGTYRKRDYCVQYRESDFNFVSRLMEDEGIFYFFRHSAGKHEMVLADAPNIHTAQLGLASLRYNINARRRSEGAVAMRWSWSQQIQTGKVTLRDHHFMEPAQNYEKKHEAQTTHPHGKIEAYDYPAGLPPFADGEAALSNLPGLSDGFAKSRLQSLQVMTTVAEGSTNALRMCTGARVKLSDHPVASQNIEYVVHSTSTRIRIATKVSGGATESTHDCEFTCFPASVPYRAARLTPKPRVSGLQSAVVVGPAGEDIHVDKHGRVKVQFHWDRDGKKDDKSSCFVRVAHASAGKGFGTLMLPRIGHEVVVDFLEGDPDQPLIVGSVYNAENVPPYLLPDNKAVSTWKSRSLKGGAGDYNELRFDDTKGSEYLLLRAQKDRDDLVVNNLSAKVGNDEARTIAKNSTLSIGEAYSVTVGKKGMLTFGEDLMLDVAKNLQIASGATMGTTVAQDFTVDAGTGYSMNAGTEVHLKAGTNLGAEAGVNAHLKGGVNVVIEAGLQLTLKAGTNSIVIGPDGVSITGMPMVKINSGGGAGSGSGAKPVKPTKPGKAPKPPELKDPLDGKHR